MIKLVYMYDEPANPIIMDRWYFRFHNKEFIRYIGPWLRRYETYRAYQAPPEADSFGVTRGRVTEIWWDSLESFAESNGIPRDFTEPPWGWSGFGNVKMITLLVPAVPTEVFLGPGPTPEAKPIIRWMSAICYPPGVTVEQGEKWFLEVHSKEVKKQAGLLKFFSHRAIQMASPPQETDTDQPAWAAAPPSPWVRLSEMWFEDFSSWRKAVIESPPKYTPPPWGGKFPFVEMISSFVPFKPDVDFLKDNPIIP